MFVATSVSPIAAVLSVGATTVLAGAGLYVLNPPTRSGDDETAAGTPPAPRRSWLRADLVALLIATAGATLVLGGTDVSIVALLRGAGQVQWIGLTAAAWGAYSMIGGFVHGAVRRSLPAYALLALLGLLTIPVGLAGSWWAVCLLLVPAGALCAPTLAATADAVSRLVPASARGEAMGLYGSALTVGMAAGAPAIGAVVDSRGPAWGPAAAGIGTLAVAGLAIAVRSGLGGRRASSSPPDVASDSAPDVAPDVAPPVEGGSAVAADEDRAAAVVGEPEPPGIGGEPLAEPAPGGHQRAVDAHRVQLRRSAPVHEMLEA